MISVNNEKCDRDATAIIIIMIGVIIDIIGEMLHTQFFFRHGLDWNVFGSCIKIILFC